MGTRSETKWERRDHKYKKRRYGMRVSGRSIKAVILRLIGRKAKQAEEHHKEEVEATSEGRPKNAQDLSGE